MLQKLTVKLRVILAAFLLLSSVLGMYQQAVFADTTVFPWLNASPLTLDKINDLSAGEGVPYSVNGNRDCQTREVITRPARLPLQSQQSYMGCVVDTGYGALDLNGNLERPGTTLAGRMLTPSGASALVIPIPYSTTALQIASTSGDGAILSFTKGLDRGLTTTAIVTGEITHTITVPPTAFLRDKAGNLLPGVIDSLSFSANGQWMVVDVPFIGPVRVNLDTFEVLPFGDALNYNIGIAPSLQTAITSDGHYAVVASNSFTVFKLYDLSTCAAVPNAISTKVACSSRDLLPFMRQQLVGFSGVSRLRFRSNGSLELYGTQLSGSVTKIARYLVTTGNQTTSGFEYLALGDSFAAGEGAYDYKALTDTPNNKCHLSQRSYPYLIANTLNLNQYESVACSGAVINDIDSLKNDYEGQVKDHIEEQFRNNKDSIISSFSPGYIPQHEFTEHYTPNTITISTVGNDIGFADKIKRCLEPDTCYSTYEDRLEVVNEINAQFYRLVDMYTQLKRATNPRAKIYAISYPQIADPSGSCALNVHLNQQELEFSRVLIDYLNSVIKAAAANAGVFYVDVSDSLHGFRLCETDSWKVAVNGLTAGNDIVNLSGIHGPIGNESFHPDAVGQQLMGIKILEQTASFTTPMPAPDATIAPPKQTDDLAILDAPKSNRPVRNLVYDPTMSNDIINRQDSWQATINTDDTHTLKPSSSFDVWLNSDPVHLGTFNSDTQGNLSFQTTIPDSVPAGFHLVHVYGKNAANEDIDIYKTIYVAATADDYNGDGVTNPSDPCVIVPPSGQDADKDGVDDACDPFIDQPPPPPIITPPTPEPTPPPITPETPPLDPSDTSSADQPPEPPAQNQNNDPTGQQNTPPSPPDGDKTQLDPTPPPTDPGTTSDVLPTPPPATLPITPPLVIDTTPPVAGGTPEEIPPLAETAHDNTSPDSLDLSATSTSQSSSPSSADTQTPASTIGIATVHPPSQTVLADSTLATSPTPVERSANSADQATKAMPPIAKPTTVPTQAIILKKSSMSSVLWITGLAATLCSMLTYWLFQRRKRGH